MKSTLQPVTVDLPPTARGTMTQDPSSSPEALRHKAEVYYEPLRRQIRGDPHARTSFYDRELVRLRSYAADMIQLQGRELDSLDRLGLLREWPTEIAEYVDAFRNWQQLLGHPTESAILKRRLPDRGRMLLAALGIGPAVRWTDADPAVSTLITGACLILDEEYEHAWDILTVSEGDQHDIYRYSDLTDRVLMILEPLAHLLRNANERVQASRTRLINLPAFAEETIASDITSTRRHDPEFADALETAQRTVPTETKDQRLLRLGLTNTNTTDTLTGLWDAQPEVIDLQGPLPPCVIQTVVVPNSTTSSDHVLHAAMRGGGTLTCRIDLAVATAAAPALVPGNLLDVTILIAPDPSDTSGLGMRALITRVEPFGAEEIELSYETPANAFPPYSSPNRQARSWGEVDASALRAAHHAMTIQYQCTDPTWVPGGVVRSRWWHYLHLTAFPGALPPTAPHNSVWRGPAETIWGGRNHLDFDQAAILPGHILKHLSNTSRIKPFLTAPQDTVNEFCHLVDQPNLDVDRDGRWNAQNLAHMYCEDGIPLAGLSAYRDVGMVDPAVAAAFQRAGINANTVAATCRTYLPALSSKYPWTAPPSWNPKGRRASPRKVHWSFLDALPQYALAGLALHEVLPTLPNQGDVN